MEFLLPAILILIIIAILLIIFLRPKQITENLSPKIDALQATIAADFRNNREELSAIAKDNRTELNNTFKEFSTEQRRKFEEIIQEQAALTLRTAELLEKITGKVEEKLHVLNEQFKADFLKRAGAVRSVYQSALKEFLNREA